MIPLKQLPAEQKAQIRERENIIRFETHCIFLGVTPTTEMRERVKDACKAFYIANLDEITVPKDVLMEAGVGLPEGMELNI